MVPCEALLVYVLILVGAAVLGWLPFRLLEYISIVDQLGVSKAKDARNVSSSRVVCRKCGQRNDQTFSYCKFCGEKLLTKMN